MSTGPARVWKQHRGHLSAWGLLCVVPAAVGSFGVLVVALGWLGQWESLALAGWLVVSPVLLTRPAERLAVRLVCGYRWPSPPEAAALGPRFAAAESLCGVPAGKIDWYTVRGGRAVNAFAAGRCSVAVSSELVEAHAAGRLTDTQVVAVLAHEIGHHATRATSYSIVIGWLTWPWQIVQAVGAGWVRGIRQRLPFARASLLLIPIVVTVAIVQLAREHAWGPIAILAGLVFVLGAQPLLEAALSRASEYAADAYAARAGAGEDLVAVLQGHDLDCTLPWQQRLQASHPTRESRVGRLQVGTLRGVARNEWRSK